MTTALTITVPAHELRPGDYSPEYGLITEVHARGTVILRMSEGCKIIPRNEQVTVHLEDTGEES